MEGQAERVPDSNELVQDGEDLVLPEENSANLSANTDTDEEGEEEQGVEPEISGLAESSSSGDSFDLDSDDEVPPGILEGIKGLLAEGGTVVEEVREPLLDSFDLEGVANLIKTGKAKRIVCMCGAGISVSAGIPDFRTPGTGLYANLQKYDLPRPEAVFDIEYFKENPKPFFMLAKELFPGTFSPTPTHYFLTLLHQKGLLLRCFTQNIDSLEHQAGLPKEAIVAAHGNFDGAACIQCRKEHSTEYVKEAVFNGSGDPCTCESCGGLVKPEIVFFGEALPERFWRLRKDDFPLCDLLIVLGTSLVVQPFASLVNRVSPETPRLLINREVAGEVGSILDMMGGRSRGFNFHGEDNYRDALFLGDADAGARQLAELLGWQAELDGLIASGTAAAPVTPEELISGQL